MRNFLKQLSLTGWAFGCLIGAAWVLAIKISPMLLNTEGITLFWFIMLLLGFSISVTAVFIGGLYLIYTIFKKKPAASRTVRVLLDTHNAGSKTMDKETLLKNLEIFQQNHTFAVGDVVQWKPGMQNKKTDGPLVVVEVLPEVILDGQESAGTPYFREPLDIILGTGEEGSFFCFHFDSRRFEPYTGK